MFTLLAVPLLFLSASFAPGFLLVRRAPFDPEEKVAASFGLSVFFLGAATVLFWALRLPASATALLPLAGLAALIPALPDAAALARDPAVRRLLRSFALLVLAGAALLAMVRNYYGPGVLWDWIEHGQRARHFAGLLPAGALGDIVIPQRPPLFNAAAGAYLALLGGPGGRFEIYQGFALLHGLLVFFPAALFARAASRGAAPAAAAALLAFNPTIVFNAAYPWSRPLAAFYAALGVWFYARGQKESGPWRVTAGLSFLAMAALVHFASAPFALVVGLHYLFRRLRRAGPGEFLLAGACILLVLASWFPASAAVYGARPTFLDNAFVHAGERLEPAERVRHILANLYRTAVPHPLRPDNPSYLKFTVQPNPWGRRKDQVFLLYQSNAFFALGAVNAVLFFLAAARRRNAPSALGPSPFPWPAFVIASALLAVAAHGTEDADGVAHACLQPLTVMGLGFLAGSLADLEARWKAAALAGLAVDFALGILWPFSYLRRVFSFAGPDTLDASEGLSIQAYLNFADKVQGRLSFLGDAPGALWFAVPALALAAAALVYGLLREWRR